MLTPHLGCFCSWGPCYLRLLKGSKAQKQKHIVFPSAEEGKCSDRSGFLREVGPARLPSELTVPPQTLAQEKKKKKKSLQLYLQGLLLFAAVCYNTAWQPPRVSLFLRLVPVMWTWPHGTADLTTRFLLFPQLVGLPRSVPLCSCYPPSLPTLPPPLRVSSSLSTSIVWQTPTLHTLFRTQI